MEVAERKAPSTVSLKPLEWPRNGPGKSQPLARLEGLQAVRYSASSRVITR